MEPRDDSALTESHTILCLDDEENILSALKRVFRKEPYQVVTTTSAAEALALLENQPIDLIISDHRMPEMAGTVFLARAKQLRPQTARLMLSGYADMQAAMDAINACEVHRFIAKPWNDDDLRLTVRQALRQCEVMALNRELTDLVKQQNQEMFEATRALEAKVRERTAELEQKNHDVAVLYRRLEVSFSATLRAFMGIMELKSPALVGHARRVSELAAQVAAHMNLSEEDRSHCEIGALLMDIGAIGFPDDLLKQHETDMDNLARSLWQKHPFLGESSLQGIEQLRAVSVVIRTHHERFDGRGFPDGLTGDDIPLASRVVAACDFFEGLANPAEVVNRIPLTKALACMSRESGSRFDPVVVEALFRVVAGRDTGRQPGEVRVGVGDLAEGMVLARDLMTSKGVLLMAGGTKLTPAHLQKILSFHQLDPVGEDVYIRSARAA
ncbi:MAG: HD domain-containing phosphohydrolase [Nitrospirota bacterium]